MTEEKWELRVRKKCLCTKPPRGFLENPIEVVPRCIGKVWSWVGLPGHEGIDDDTNGMLVETDSLRPLTPKPPVKKGDYVEVRSKSGSSGVAVGMVLDADSRQFSLTNRPGCYSYEDVIITKLVPELARPLPTEPPVEIGEKVWLCGIVKAGQDHGFHQFDFGEYGREFEVVSIIGKERIEVMADGFGNKNAYGNGRLFINPHDALTKEQMNERWNQQMERK